MARILRFLVFGALGGFVGWLITEPFDYLTPSGERIMQYNQIFLLGLIVGLFSGLGIALAEASSGVSRRDAQKMLTLGVGLGAAGGALGLCFGNAFYIPVQSIGKGTPLAFFTEIFARSIGWALIGLAIGISQGIASESPKKMTNGAIGGFIGGLIGGFVFAILNIMNSTKAVFIPVEMMRLIGFTTTAGCAGLFIGFVEELAKQAWLVHLRGKNEGKQYVIYKPETYVGRDEFADVPVFGDPDVQPRHFAIKTSGKRHFVVDLNTSAGTLLNNQKVQQQHILNDGDIIQIGMTKLLFRDKATRSVISRSTDNYMQSAQIPQNPNMCPFCGQMKDASGNCSCSVGSGAAPQATVMNNQTQFSAPTQMGQPGVTMQQTAQIPVQPPFGSDPFAAPQPMATGGVSKLIAMAGPYSGQNYLLSAQETTIGRQSDRIISLSTDNTVSRMHAKVVNEGGQFVVYDEGSANGTYVNNAKITRHVLSAGDLIQVGSTKFRFE